MATNHNAGRRKEEPRPAIVLPRLKFEDARVGAQGGATHNGQSGTFPATCKPTARATSCCRTLGTNASVLAFLKLARTHGSAPWSWFTGSGGT